jgi:hypothetical protein
VVAYGFLMGLQARTPFLYLFYWRIINFDYRFQLRGTVVGGGLWFTDTQGIYREHERKKLKFLVAY